MDSNLHAALPVACFTALTFLISGPYLVRAYRRQFVPQFVTWYLLAAITGASGVVQLQHGAVFGSLTLLLAASMNGLIGLFAMRAWLVRRRDPRTREAQYLKPSDFGCAAVSLVALVFWLAVDNTNAAVVLLGTASLVAFWPTIRRARSATRLQDLEPAAVYERQTFRYMFAVLAIQQFAFTTTFYPLLWVGVNGTLAVFLTRRARRLSLAETPVADAEPLEEAGPVTVGPDSATPETIRKPWMDQFPPEPISEDEFIRVMALSRFPASAAGGSRLLRQRYNEGDVMLGTSAELTQHLRRQGFSWVRDVDGQPVYRDEFTGEAFTASYLFLDDAAAKYGEFRPVLAEVGPVSPS